MAGHEWWLISRSAGVVALVLVAVSVLIGLTLAAGLGGPPQRRRALVAFHEQTALAGLVAIALHGIALLGDQWLKPGIAGIAVPFVVDYRPVSVAAGIAGGYLAAILGLSFYARKRIGGKRWRNLHRATPVVYALGLIHTLGAGTDAGSTWLRAFMLSTALAAAALLVARGNKSRARNVRQVDPQPRGS
jgi:methionine sulfoxide reductase heme-binding subunit